MLVVVGGHSRNVGKTSVAAGLIAAFRHLSWTAIKITQHGHGICSTGGVACGCAGETARPVAVDEETAPSHTDSGRFLAAGARRSYWLRTPQGKLGDALPALRQLVSPGSYTLVESNSILQYYQPDLYLQVLDPATADFKDSARRYLDRADALVFVRQPGEAVAWQRVPERLWRSKPCFLMCPPEYCSPELLSFVAGRILASY
jgi:hypothetical protein